MVGIMTGCGVDVEAGWGVGDVAANPVFDEQPVTKSRKTINKL